MRGFPFFTKRANWEVRSPFVQVEPQEVLLDVLAARHQEEQGAETPGLELPLSHLIFKGLLGTYIILALLFAGRTAQLQVLAGAELQEKAANNTFRIVPQFAERGIIYDSAMHPLVFNVASFDFVCDKREVSKERKEKERLLHNISSTFALPFNDLKEMFDQTASPEVLFKSHLSHEEVVIVETKKDHFLGCQIKQNLAREYPYKEMLAHALGYTAKISEEELEKNPDYFIVDQIGKMGVEKSYEEFLRGVPGEIRTKKDSQGRSVGEKEFIPSQEGKNVVLWLQLELHKKLHEALQESLQRIGGRKGAAVAMDPKTGGILAMASMPSFDPNAFSSRISQEDWDAIRRDSAQPLFNRVISGDGYPTGSVIKPLVALNALEKGIITKDTHLYSPLELCTWNKFLGQDECFRDWTFHGDTDVKRAIAESVNTFFYMIGGGYKEQKGLGASAIKEFLQKFQWGQKTGIDLPSEGNGVLPEIDKNWRLGDTYHFSIGQGAFSIPPLQVASAFTAIANGGQILQPQMVKEVRDREQNVLFHAERKVLAENLADPKNLQIVREGMRQTVTKGSATGFLDSLPVSAAAKTGTAQMGKKKWGKDVLTSWVVTFAPYENPEIVLVVMVEDVIEGEVATLPVARDVLQWYFSR